MVTLKTLAKKNPCVRNPFTHRCIDLDSKAAKELMTKAKKPHSFKHELKHKGMKKSEIKEVIKQWKYLAGISDKRPSTLPVKGQKKEVKVLTAPLKHERSSDDKPIFKNVKKEPSDDKPKTSKRPIDDEPALEMALKRPRLSDDVKPKIQLSSCDPKRLGLCRKQLRETAKDDLECRKRLRKLVDAYENRVNEIDEKDKIIRKQKRKIEHKKTVIAMRDQKARWHINEIKALKRKVRELSPKPGAPNKGSIPKSRPAIKRKIQELTSVTSGKNAPPAKKAKMEQAKDRPPLWLLNYFTKDPALSVLAGDKTVLAGRNEPAIQKYKNVFLGLLMNRHDFFLDLLYSTHVDEKHIKKLTAFAKRTVRGADAKIKQFKFVPFKHRYTLPQHPNADLPSIIKHNQQGIAFFNEVMGYPLDDDDMRYVMHNIALYSVWQWMSDPEVYNALIQSEPELVFLKEETDHVQEIHYDNPKKVDLENFKDMPMHFFLGAGASVDAGIPTFSGLGSVSTAEFAAKVLDVFDAKYNQNRRLEDENALRKYPELAKMRAAISEQLNGRGIVRTLLSENVMKKFPELLSMVWQYMAESCAAKKPGRVHHMLKWLQDTPMGDEGGLMLGQVMSMNIDGLELAAGVDPIVYWPIHGNIFVAQDKASGRLKPLGANDIERDVHFALRPAITLYGELEWMAGSDYDIIKQEVNESDSILVVVGASSFTGVQYLKGLHPTTTILINPWGEDIKMFEKALKKEKSFSTVNLYAFKTIEDLEVVCKRLKIDTPYKPVSRSNTSKENLALIVERLAEIKEDIDKEEGTEGKRKEKAATSSDEEEIDLSLSDDEDD